jgi:hypothetical protein
MFKVSDAARVKKVVAALCAEVKKKGAEIPVTGLVSKEDSCSGEISLEMLKPMIGAELPPFKFSFTVPGDLLVLAFRLQHGDSCPVGFQFVRDSRRERGTDALAHFTTPAPECGIAVGCDMQKGVGCKRFFRASA